MTAPVRPALLVPAGALAVLLVLLVLPLRTSPWLVVGSRQLDNISGLAFVSATASPSGAPAADGMLLAVHDNKLADEPRLGLVRQGDGRYTPLRWPAGSAPPVDLEAVSAVPGRPGMALALSYNGTVFVLTLSGTDVALRGSFTLPDRQPGANFEGLRAQQVGGTQVLAWGDRGTGRRPARLTWARVDLDSLALADVHSTSLLVPYPSDRDAATRHLTDVDISPEGDVWIAAASDPGDLGPFHSAVYQAGRLVVDAEGRVSFEPAPRLRTTQAFDHKIEALAVAPGRASMVVGTDDEFLGSALLTIPR